MKIEFIDSKKGLIDTWELDCSPFKVDDIVFIDICDISRESSDANDLRRKFRVVNVEYVFKKIYAVDNKCFNSNAASITVEEVAESVVEEVAESVIEETPEKQKAKEILRSAIVKYAFGLSFKSLLMTYEEVADLYEGGVITRDDFDNMVEELEEKLNN